MSEKMDEKLYISHLTELLNDRDYASLLSELREDNEVDIALFMETLPDDETAFVFRMLPKEICAEVFAHLESDTQRRVVEAFTDEETTQMLDQLFVDDAVDFLEEMPANMVNRILRLTNPDKRRVINRYLQYPEDSAGSIMTAEYTRLKQDMTVAQAITHLRTFGEDRETIYTCYVTDEQRFLEGVISVKAILLADDGERIGDIMETDIISVNTTMDREEVVRLFHKYNFLAIPVVDNENRLVGIVTIDDAVDVMQEETTEDFEKMAAIAPSEKPYLKTSFWQHGMHRITWLFILMVSGMINGLILEKHEAAFIAYPLLVSFIPMLTDTGGNVGSQSSTLMIRGMTLGEIKISDIFRVIIKESATSLLMGTVLSAVNFVRVYLIYRDFTTALILALAMIATVFMAAVIGGILPLIAKKLRIDPAIMAAPLITTLVDAAALAIYFAIAVALLKI
ncbi:MAG TPA: magnesium transporter [Bacillota bacterium]|jgi:magnesium transporter|nr:magnesium transporter [Fastidiosipila sp.]HPX93638.1 magnesium transporter [Bacillota bacterium]HQB81502.1 magnesium transporter [Bacillota bacterium]